MSSLERDRLGLWGNGDNVVPSKSSGLDKLRDPNLNKVRVTGKENFHSNYVDMICTFLKINHIFCYLQQQIFIIISYFSWFVVLSRNCWFYVV